MRRGYFKKLKRIKKHKNIIVSLFDTKNRFIRYHRKIICLKIKTWKKTEMCLSKENKIERKTVKL